MLRVHIHRRNAEVPSQGAWERDLRASVFGPVDGNGRAPSFVVFDALTDQRCDGFVKRGGRAIVFIQACFERGAWCEVLYFVEEFDAFVDELLRCGVLVQIDIFAVAAVVAHLDSQDARMCSTLLMKQCVA